MNLLRPTLLSAAALTLSIPLLAQTAATGDSRPLRPPQYPAVCQVVTAHFDDSLRATPPAMDDTTRLQAALTACANTGQAVELAASGSNDAFYSGTINVTGEAVVVDAGVTLYGNDSYPKYLLNITGTNAGVYGPGTIDGRGDLISGKPRLVEVRDIQNFTAAYITLTHAGKMHLYVEGGDGFTAWHIHIQTPANTKNTDGIDIDSLTNATVIGSIIEDGDDGVVVKTNSGPASNITVRDNRFYGTHGMSIGSQTMYDVTNVLWENNVMFGTDEWGNLATDDNGIRIKSDPTCGGPVNQVTYRNTTLIGIKHLLEFNTHYGTCSGVPGVPVYQNIIVDGVTATQSVPGAYSEFNGYSETAPLQLYLAHVHLDVNDQQKSQYAIVGLDDSTITPSGPGVTTFPFTMSEGGQR